MGSNYIFQNKNPARRVSLFYIFFCKMLLLLLFSHCFVLFWLCPIVLWPYGLYSLPGSSVRGISQARKLEWVAIPSSRWSSGTRDQTRVSCIGRQILYHWATREAQIAFRSSLIEGNSRIQISILTSNLLWHHMSCSFWRIPLCVRKGSNTLVFLRK